MPIYNYLNRPGYRTECVCGSYLDLNNDDVWIVCQTCGEIYNRQDIQLVSGYCAQWVKGAFL